MEQNTNIPWVEKYRPDTLNDILSHTEIVKTLKICIKNKTLPHLLFYGPPGCGKTSTIMAVAKELYGKYVNCMVLELNASDDRGIDVVRNKIKQFVMTESILFGKTAESRKNIFKLVILDETDAMTADAQAILRKIVEEYTVNARFCLICNYIQNISHALQSRCTKFRFTTITNDFMKQKLTEILTKQNIPIIQKKKTNVYDGIDDSGFETIIKRSRGDMRKVLNILQSVTMSYSLINENNINNFLGYPTQKNITDIMENLVQSSYSDAYTNIIKIKQKSGLALGDIITEIHDNLINYVITGDTKIHIIKQITINNVVKILDKLRDIEYNHSVNTLDNIQIAGLISIFKGLVY